LSGVQAAALGMDRYLTMNAADAVVRYLSTGPGEQPERDIGLSRRYRYVSPSGTRVNCQKWPAGSKPRVR
jgi:hypothetical protein